MGSHTSNSARVDTLWSSAGVRKPITSRVLSVSSAVRLGRCMPGEQEYYHIYVSINYYLIHLETKIDYGFLRQIDYELTALIQVDVPSRCHVCMYDSLIA